MIKSIRGAVQFAADDKEVITNRVQYLVRSILEKNNLQQNDLVNILFSITDDLKTVNPAAALRAGGEYVDVPLFCAKEPETDGSMKMMLRLMITCEWGSRTDKVRHLYIDGAEKLRPDLS